MAQMLIIGNTLVQPEEYAEKKLLNHVDDFIGSLDQQKPKTLEFSSGTVRKEDIDATFESLTAAGEEESATDAPGSNPRTPIGLGKPLCVEILTIYTGDYPNGIFGGKKDLLLTSAIKSSVTFDAAARAINKIDKRPAENTYIEFNANEPGTRVVYYTPAVDALNTSISFELVADTFEQEIFDTISKLLLSLGTMPIFMPAATWLLGGSQVIKLAGNLGNTIFARKPYLKDNYEVKFNNAGDLDSIARNLLIFNDADADEFKDYEARLQCINDRTKFRLVKKSDPNAIYQGRAPYLIINLDGQTRDDLQKFTPKLASSAILQKFYGDDDTPGAIAQTIEQAMQLFNDMSYKEKADNLNKVVQKMPEGPDKIKNKALLQAYQANIVNDIFK